MTDIQVSIENFREYEENASKPLKAEFALVIHPYGQKILKCKYFKMRSGGRWFTFPQIKLEKGLKEPKYIPLVSYKDKSYLELLKIAVLEELDKFKLDTDERPTEIKESVLQTDASDPWK
jgi:hypothetical protein